MGKSAMLRRVLATLLASVLSFHFALASQSKSDDGDQDEKVYDLGPGVAPPRVTKQVPPRQSGNRGVRIVGSVIVALVVSSHGVPKDVRVTKGLDKEVDQNTVEAVEQWRFAPAQRDGKPIAVRISLEIAFHDM
jgi:protein TonB